MRLRCTVADGFAAIEGLADAVFATGCPNGPAIALIRPHEIDVLPGPGCRGRERHAISISHGCGSMLWIAWIDDHFTRARPRRTRVLATAKECIHVAYGAIIAYIADMLRNQSQTATLTIRNVPSAAKERLRVRAAVHGRSMEAELRAILSAALDNDTDHTVNLAEAIRRRFAQIGSFELHDLPQEMVGDTPDFVS